ncbi:MAG TPA: hypothetical protein VKS81_11990, partial [Bacteroidota bacterium]|nr:hypothetical protein [Bacteroidota bacterium]
QYHFLHNGNTVRINDASNTVHSVDCSKNNCIIDMRYYYAMRALMNGMLNTNRVHFVNVEHLASQNKTSLRGAPST